VIEERHADGHRIYLINVPPGLEEIRVGGKLRSRQGTACEELSGDRARDFLERRRNFDWTAAASGLHCSDADAAAVEAAVGHYRAASGRSLHSAVELVRRLGVGLDDSDDPELSRAGAFLLCPCEPAVVQLRVLVTRTDGAPARRHEDLVAPLLTAFDEIWQIVDDTFPATAEIVGAQRRSIRAVPEVALREAIVNALMHRDYRLAGGSILVQAIGDPPAVLKVTSPGGFPRGVQRDRLLAGRSQPRNPALAYAMRTLGLSEVEGVGVDTMYRVMLRDGHAAPDIREDGGDVVCRLAGGPVDRSVRNFFEHLYASDPILKEDARAHIVVSELLARTPVRAGDLAGPAQCSESEAAEVLTRLEEAGALERLLNAARSYRLTRSAREALRSRIGYPMRQPLEESWEMVRAFLDVNPVIGQRDVVGLLGVQPVAASRILGRLSKERHLIEPVANDRGRGVRYRLVSGPTGR
jgi:ATP-dependent DNA helicase RecG